MPKPTLGHLLEDHFKPKWWQFWRKQQYHVCWNWGNIVIYRIPTKCAITEKLHEARPCARIYMDEVTPQCDDKCSAIKASDPFFFSKLDSYLARECYNEPLSLKAEKLISSPAQTYNTSGPAGSM